MNAIELNGFKSVDEFTHPTMLGQDTLSELNNMVLDQYLGKPTKRGGIIRFNSNTVSEIESDRGFRSLHDVIIDSSGNNLLLGAAGTEFLKSENGTGDWTAIKIGLTDNLRTRLAVYGNKFYVTNGVDTPFLTDATDVWDLALEVPDVSDVTITYPITKPSADTSFLDEGYYYYTLVYRDAKGNISLPSDYIFAEISGNTFCRLQNLPTPIDTRIVSKYLYRTQVISVGTVPIGISYLVTVLDSDATEYQDGVIDSDLDLSEYLEYPVELNSFKYLTVHKNRLISANISRNNVGVIKPTAMTLEDQTSGGSMADGVYSYKVRWIFDSGLNSNLSSAVSVTVSGGGGSGRVDITLPVYGFISNYKNFGFSIVGFELFRTKARSETVSTYYKIAEYPSDGNIDPDDGWQYTDTVADAELTAELTIDETTENTAIYVSEIDKFSTIKNTRFDVHPDDGDEITGIFDDEDGILIFKKNSICKLFTSGSPEDWVLKKLVESIGCDSPDTIAGVEDSYYFMNKGEVYTYNSPRGYFATENTLVKLISKQRQQTFQSVDTYHMGAYISKANWYVLAADINNRSYLLIYDAKLQTWYKFFVPITTEGWQTVIEKQHGDNRGSIIIGNYKNSMLKYYVRTSLADYGNKDYALDGLGDFALDGEDDVAYIGAGTKEIEPSLVTKQFYANGLVRLHKVVVNYEKRDGKSIVIEIIDPDSGGFVKNVDQVDSLYASGVKTIKKYTDGFDGTLKRTEKLKIKIYGAGLETFINLRVLYIPDDFGYKS